MYFQNSFMNWTAKCYQWWVNFFSNFQSIFLFIMRVTWGHLFFLAGLGKFSRMDATILFFQTHGMPSFFAYFVGLLEIVGGLCLVIGLGSRFFAFLLAIAMFVAFGTEHVEIFTEFKFIRDPSLIVKEPPFPFLITSLLVLFFGPGKISLDGWIKRILKGRSY